jgi:homospermidine synthase
MDRNIVILGCGGVGKAVLYYLPKFIRCNYNHVTILDALKTTAEFPAVQACIAKGARFLHYEVTAQNIHTLFDKILKLSKGDIVIDVTTRTPTLRIFAECRKRGILFCNTDINKAEEGSIEHLQKSQPFADSLYMYHVALEEMDSKTRHYPTSSVTCVNESGMNPGLISVFVKKGLRDMARHVLRNGQRNKAYVATLRSLLRKEDYRGLCETLDVQVIHCSEIDTQKPSPERQREIKHKHILVNTWSVNGMVEEATEKCAISLGTHERTVPVAPSQASIDIVPHVGVIHKPGIHTYFRSYLPVGFKEDGSVVFGEIKGVALPHGETFSLQKYLTSDTYAPTMHYVYQMNPLTMSLIKGKTPEELTKWTWDPRHWKVMNVLEDGLKGTDNVGATFLLGTNPLTGTKGPWGWWAGSILDDHYTRTVLKDPYFGPTVIPVMAGILSGTAWAIRNPHRGMVYPEAMDDRFIFQKVKKYLGRWHSGPITGVRIRGTRFTQLMVSKTGSHKARVPTDM